MVRTRPLDLVVVFSAEYQAVHVYIPKCTEVRGVHDCHEVYEYRSSTHFSTVSLIFFFRRKDISEMIMRVAKKDQLASDTGGGRSSAYHGFLQWLLAGHGKSFQH